MTKISSEVLLASNLFVEGRFTVPWHQRYYDWNVEQIDELLVDLKEALDEGRTSYFLGTIMLVERGGAWEINDGQQRLITVSLIFAALKRQFSKRSERDSEGREATTLNILFVRGPGSEHSLEDQTRDIPRITPPRHDRSRFTQIIRGYDIGTDGKLTSAWNEISLFVRAMGSDEMDAFFDFIVKKVEIVVLYVPHTEDVNAVFETINGRGKQLDDVDLIRNHLYSFFSGSADEERRVTVHEQLESTLATCRTVNRFEQYCRCFFQCKYGYIQKNRFYRETRKKIRDSTNNCEGGDYVYEMIRELASPSIVELFRTVTATNPSTELLKSFYTASNTSRKKRNLRIFLQELAGYKVALPLIFALIRKFLEADDNDRKSIAKAVNLCLSDVCSFVMRVSFCSTKFEPSRYEATFANCAQRITASSDLSDLKIRTELEECDEIGIMSDARFIALLSDIKMTDSRRAKRLLFGLNRLHESEPDSLNFTGCAVEHILPRSPKHWAGWTGFHSAEIDILDSVFRIGNLTLLGTSDGRDRSNANFTVKKNSFSQSPIKITRQLASYDDWTPEIVKARSEEIASEAAKVWSFPSRRK